MRTRNAGIMFAALLALAALSFTYHTLSAAPLTRTLPVPQSIGEEYLRGSMQGRSGIALDINGDGNDELIVGAPFAQHAGSSGALLVYSGIPGGLSARPSTVLKGEGNLGWSLTALGLSGLDAKGSFAAGAVNGSGPKASLAGTVSVYKAGRTLQRVVTLEGENALDRFGYTLASGDVNGDGYTDLIVGAPMHSPTPSLFQQGAVYVFFGPAFNSPEAVKIPASATLMGIGFSLATGDINNDGFDDLLVGATGKVAAYYGGPSFSAAGPNATFAGKDAGFGRSVAVLWDVNGDGYKDLAVGAFQAVVGDIADVGRLLVIKGGNYKGTVDSGTVLLASVDGEPNSGQFATALLPAKDIRGDNILAVSAAHADGSPWPMTGKLFLFSGTDVQQGTPVGSVKSIPGNARDMHLGTFLAQVQGRRGTLLAAGAPTEDTNTGRVRLFELSTFGR